MRGRSFILALHRWAGLTTLAFLLLLGLTGSLLVFHREIDEWLNPDWFFVEARQASAPVDAVVKAAEAAISTHRVTGVDLPDAPGEAMKLVLRPRPGVSEAAQAQRFQLFADPHDGRLLGWRDRNALRLDRRHIVSFLYKLHYSLHLGDWGIWFLGGVGLIWLLDNFWAAWLSFPRLRLWRRSFGVKREAGVRRATYDAHRAGGLWMWPVLVVLALSGVAMNLNQPFRAVVSWFSPLPPTPEDRAPERDLIRPVAYDVAVRAAAPHGVVDALYHDADKGLYLVAIYGSGDRGYYGETYALVDGGTGLVRSIRRPADETAGETFLAWQFPLHSGEALGMPGRILIALAGLATAGLCATGLVLFGWRRRPQRATSQGKMGQRTRRQRTPRQEGRDLAAAE